MSKILIIDDDPDFVLATSMVLEGEGFTVATATTPEEGVEKVPSEKPDLVVLDVLMPNEYEGFEVAHIIREELGLKQLPILMLTAVHGVKKVPYRFAPDETYLPVDVFMDKPIQPDTLVQTVKEMLGDRREEPKHPL
jgi:two-component system, OmpR family, alkaline phosphatase synthesis response regulator PhoP